ncbi:MAG: PD-(D/E)XK nuclease family transposase [Synergistaceae bacterium]|nr:PD-(D/E)XK nuclease family transposase [Synergistaceae bacterium]MBQ9582480.1 PD-(D/E)XK nuclease family transposase [Synergistaceae bacterium]
MDLEATRELMKRACLMDDFFMKACFRDLKCVEVLIRVILDRDDLIVKSAKTQEYIKGLEHDVIFDIFAVDSDNKGYDIELQNTSKDASIKRARFYAGMLDSRSLKSGEPYDSIRDNYIIFITQKDVLRGGLPLYTIERCIKENGRFINDGLHIIYVNGKMRGAETKLSRLMHDLFCENPDDMYYTPLADRTRHFKEDEGGLAVMSGLSEELMNIGIEKGIEKGVKQGIEKDRNRIVQRLLNFGKMTVEEISNMLDIPLADVQRYANQH